MPRKEWVSTYAGSFRGGAYNNASSSVASVEVNGARKSAHAPNGNNRAAGIVTDQDDPRNRVAAIIKPGGTMQDHNDNVAVEARTCYGTSFLDNVRNVGSAELNNVKLVARAHSARRATHERCIEHMGPEEWREVLQSEYASMPQHDKMPRALKSSRRWRASTREEHERRWRTWQERQMSRGSEGGTPRSHRDGDVGSRCTNTNLSISTMPAGLRVAKGLQQLYPGGVRLPLFGADRPVPVWTTLADAPWAVERAVTTAPAQPEFEPAWVTEYDSQHTAKMAKGPFGRFGASLVAQPQSQPQPLESSKASNNGVYHS